MTTYDKDPRQREHVKLLHQAAAKVRADVPRAQAAFRINPAAALSLAVLLDEAEWAVGRGDLQPSSVRHAVVDLATRISAGTGE